ncbi:MAG: macro domain-containing protein [Verrucomicrobiota bacterium]|jgi:O-acetyl-ADP-ribose deacetylase (regulator of RNase III)|nr:macro domain-containing protein [Verrucomicrobiota bacterium]
MISFRKGDLFDSDVEAYVNTVNCVGVMGRGVALQFKKRFPDNFKTYEKVCKQGKMIPGKMLVYEASGTVNPKHIINFPTKRHWRGASRMEDIDAGLQDLLNVIQTKKITSIALPPLGCGLGGLDWNVVRARMESVLGQLSEVRVEIYEPIGAPQAEKMVRNRETPEMTLGRAALVGLVRRYLGGLLDPFITLLEIHKLMYFLQVSGEPLKLNYVKKTYGPYAENLRHVLNKIEGHLLSGYADGGDKPDKPMGIVPGAAEDSERFLANHPETRARMNRVEKLVDGFETPFGLELLATVHWVAEHGVKGLDEIVAQVYAWNDHKRQFSQRQIELAWNRLTQQGWLACS